MKRTKNHKVDLILTSDWHLREDSPICRTDDFWNAQWLKVVQVSELQKKYHCPVIHGGDLFHHWKPSPWLLSTAIGLIPKGFYTVFGQHDLPQHNLELDHKSGINTLRQAEVVGLLKYSFGETPKEASCTLLHKQFEIGEVDWTPTTSGTISIVKNRKKRKILVWHKFVWDGVNLPWPGCDGLTAKQVLKKYPEFDLIVTGDHHKPFTYEYKGRLLVNPGCLTRQASDYVNHRPRVYLWNAETNKVRIHYLEIEKDVISREHIEKKEQVDKRLESFISRLSEDWEVAVSFEENLRRFLQNNKIKQSVIDLVYKAIDI